MKAKDFDRKFDDGEDDMLGEMELASARRVNQEQKSLSIDFPEWMITRLEEEARRLGVTRQAIIKIWLSERLENL